MKTVGNESKTIKNIYRWNYYHHISMLPLLGDNHCLPLLYMAKFFIWLEETGEPINDSEIGYMIILSLHFIKSIQRTSIKWYEYYIW